MAKFQDIQLKLEQFIRRFYTNELLKGAILFFALGFLYFLFTLFVEYILWLNTSARTILFWAFIGVELALFYKFIAIPLAKLFKLQKGIDFKEASKLIGNHFPEVQDKLLNVLQLNESGDINSADSELLLASINQKSAELQPIPFKLAVNFKSNLKYLKYAAIPIVILFLTFITGHINWFSDSYQRVVNYKTAYEPPAPFQFFILNESLNTNENTDFKLKVSTAGDVVPENVKITFNKESYVLQQVSSGNFEYVFSKPKSDIEFQLSANTVKSKPYVLNVFEVPSLLNFEMFLDYPSYTKRTDEILKSTGNAIVPQGTKITWKLATKATDHVHLISKDTLELRKTDSDRFETTKQVSTPLDYSLTTSNSKLKNYEILSYSIDVITDEHPELSIKMAVDSLDQQSLYFHGQASDDYGLSKLQLVYYPIDNQQLTKFEPIPISSSNVADFITAFPNQLDLKEGVSYNLFFQVFDNDALNNYKSTKSTVYSYRKLTQEEEEQKQLEQQNETIQNLDKSLEKFQETEKELESLSKTQKEKAELNFNDKRQLENFLKRQKQQEEMMQNFNKELKENLEQFQQQNEENDQFKEDLKERLKDNEEQLKKDEKLLEELEKLQDKINKEELSEKLEQLAKQNKSKKRSLEQLLELTKKYYVTKKFERLQKELEDLAKKQLDLSNETKENNTKEKQEELNKEFEDFQKEMEKLEKENESLIDPMKIPNNEKQEEDIKKDQKDASEELGKKEKNEENSQEEDAEQNEQNATKKQKQAGEKMKNMSQKMQASMQMMGGGGEQMQEDIAMLRQILDNLVLFSFDQEALMNQFKSIEVNHNKYAEYLKKQHTLKEHFSHIDDSLFALSLRQPKLSEFVNREISEVFYNIDKSLEQFSDNNIFKGASNQQYTITAANNLADFLSNIMDSMQMQSSGQGSGGQGKPEQGLPDIIMSQEELNKQMEDGMKKSQDGKPKEDGEEGKEGEKGKDGDKGKSGDKEGKDGKDGNSGNDGQQQGEGEGSMSDEMHGELFRIYQQQQEIRRALEEKLAKEGINPGNSNLLKQMEQVEMDLLNKGFTQRTLEKMMNLQHQLLKMENATFQQGQDTKRKAETNATEFENNTNNQIPKAKEYFNTNEILNRQSLPLQPIYNKKVKDYFKLDND
ncbi:DUF4175 family protein [Xanthomarina sp. F1114]|uniref:DUF4175 family protein n=1 Tax=Xanthomarina sp. F1114 TaxID=2996019 RepID=UPI00225DF3D4|nr:DUF4175 family protein [Xanthomarina sp. F1114]MCX7546588.1 DUF4175 family protein [Xanthomarina sp. F1114]